MIVRGKYLQVTFEIYTECLPYLCCGHAGSFLRIYTSMVHCGWGWVDGGGLLLDGTHWYHCPRCLAPPGTNSSPFSYPLLQPSTRMRTIYRSYAFTCSIAARAPWKKRI